MGASAKPITLERLLGAAPPTAPPVRLAGREWRMEWPRARPRPAPVRAFRARRHVPSVPTPGGLGPLARSTERSFPTGVPSRPCGGSVSNPSLMPEQPHAASLGNVRLDLSSAACSRSRRRWLLTMFRPPQVGNSHYSVASLGESTGSVVLPSLRHLGHWCPAISQASKRLPTPPRADDLGSAGRRNQVAAMEFDGAWVA